MNKREKILAALVGVCLLLLIGNLLLKRVSGQFAARGDRIEKLKRDLNKKKVIRHRGKIARRVLGVYEQRSLPSDPVLASSRYRAWLHDWIESVGIRDETVKYVSARQNADAYTLFTFAVQCQGDLRQLVRLLYGFYSRDYLHRIKHMSIKRLKDKQLVFAFTIEALALPGAPRNRKLGDLPSNRLAFSEVDPYLEIIVNRNPYAPANQAPQFVDAGTKRAYLNQRVTITPQVKDPENDHVTYRLGPTDLPGLTIDEKTGRIEWTPTEKGEFEVLVYAIDDGLPSKQSEARIKIEVTDPPPPPAPTPPFDKSKFCFVTGIVEIDGRPEVWLTSRTDGQLIKLHEGDRIEIGLLKGTVLRIHPKSIEIRVGDTVRSVRYGQSLAEGTVVTRQPST